MSIGLSSRLILFYTFLRQLQEKRIRVTELAEILETSKPNVSQLLNQLTEVGFLDHEPYGPIQLTPSGLKYSKRLYTRILLLESFLFKSLSLPYFQARAEAFGWEQEIYDTTLNAIEKKLTISIGLAGDKIPDKFFFSTTIHKLNPGQKFRIEAFTNIGLIDNTYLSLLSSIYLEQAVLATQANDNVYTLVVNNHPVILPSTIAEKMLVSAS